MDLPEGELRLQAPTAGPWDIPLVLPSPGTYRMRWQWVFNPDLSPITSPLKGCDDALYNPRGHEAAMGDRDQYCLVQVWRIAVA
ncbi:hypothetical protein SAMN05421806_13331 [Streptomyces indicus]|uniref:Uncharacterized protein n=1 Tax=Streptomyces indicus TaxID=417292 RepID=A0A1G9JQ24_9ACTN|nr:hypothetical protein SAMN05421806_13331 [Streptomyces indicus]